MPYGENDEDHTMGKRDGDGAAPPPSQTTFTLGPDINALFRTFIEACVRHCTLPYAVAYADWWQTIAALEF